MKPDDYELTLAEWEFIKSFLHDRGLPTDRDVTFGDVYLRTRYSEVRSRSEITDFSTEIAPDIQLGLPLIMANMVCVADAKSIGAFEREGGLGIPPQMLDLKTRLEMLDEIGRRDSALIDNPLTIYPDATLEEAKKLMSKRGISSLVVINSENRPIGILSTRDWKYETDGSKFVGDLMGGKRKLYAAKRGVSFSAAAKILRKHRIEKLPLLGKNGVLAGLITAHGLFYKHHYPRAMRDEKGRFLKVGSIGVGKYFTANHMKEVRAQVRKGICLLLIDTARAFSINTKEAVKAIKAEFPELILMVGNVDCPEGAKALFSWGADIVKVGIGPGEACRTREVAVGMPQISAIAKCAAVARMQSIGGKRKYIVADGGMKNPGDVCKALVAGADAVMSGSLFIGAIESAAKANVNKQGLRVKEYVGSASFKAQEERLNHKTLDETRRPEGVSQEMPVLGTMEEVIDDIKLGMKSAFSYIGVRTVRELKEKGKFGLQTPAGLKEGIKK